MPLNLTIWKINNFCLILYGEISVLIGPILRLFVTGALKGKSHDFTSKGTSVPQYNLPLQLHNGKHTEMFEI